MSVRLAPLKRYKCTLCCESEIFRCNRDLFRHLRVKHGVQNLFRCKKCDKSFHNDNQLYVHKQKEHHEQPLQNCPYEGCSYTGLPFHVKKHKVKMHERRYEVKCKECGVTAICQNTLDRHNERRHGITRKRRKTSSINPRKNAAKNSNHEDVNQKDVNQDQEDVNIIASTAKFEMPSIKVEVESDDEAKSAASSQLMDSTIPATKYQVYSCYGPVSASAIAQCLATINVPETKDQEDVNQEDVNQEDVNQEDVNQEYVHQEDVHQEDVNQEDANQEDVNDDVNEEDVNIIASTTTALSVPIIKVEVESDNEEDANDDVNQEDVNQEDVNIIASTATALSVPTIKVEVESDDEAKSAASSQLISTEILSQVTMSDVDQDGMIKVKLLNNELFTIHVNELTALSGASRSGTDSSTDRVLDLSIKILQNLQNISDSQSHSHD